MDRPVCVLGAGSWGTVVAALASGPVRLWARRDELAQEINATRRNARYTAELHLSERLWATSSLREACQGAAAVLVAVPSAGFRAVATELVGLVAADAPVLSLTKGIERGTHETMTGILRSCLPSSSVGVLTGPNLAKELALGMPAACVVALGDEEGLRLVQERLHGPSFRVYTTTDVTGCEVAGATKNVLAIAAGVSDGLGFGDNTRATIITRGLAEMGRLGVAMGGEALTFGGLAGVGDLVATCTSDRSRNRRVGIGLGSGLDLDAAIARVGEVAEGVTSAEPLVALARDRGVELPICEQVAGMVAGDVTPAEALAALTARPARGEWDVELLRGPRR
ncbi:MAG TPA: NAD(P)H-dependent glycerol-3-phosphate dehydrogenase [Acidimicrobiales bacterium]|jgi:glycerol-3-phosphate dehydrogenase (NAD(P)+)|nr:NAD(P)H-dependent glycerol-3-phosphate dehydrogenase [Acidimicrobiales bacterium]